MQRNSRSLLPPIFALIVLTSVALALYFTSPTDGDFWWYDASRHAMNGVFIRDFIIDGGVQHPIQFASAYYQKYPAINIGFYPPFFYLTSAPFLAIFGPTHAVSQAVVTLYALGAMLSIYFLCSRQMSRVAALAAAACVITFPEMALWARQVQLDIPAIALLIVAAFALTRYLENQSRSWLYAATSLLGIAILTRAQAICVIPAVMFFLFIPKYAHLASLKTRILALVPLIILSMPSLAMVAYFSRVNQSQVVQMPGMPRLLSFGNWGWYASYLPEQIGWPALVFTTCGLAAALVLGVQKRLPTAAMVAGMFCLSSWIFFSLISNKEPRFNLPSVPFLFLFSVFALNVLFPFLTRFALLVLALWLAFQALAVAHVPVVGGYKEAVELAQNVTPRNTNVLISAHRDGSFIYDMRTIGKRRDIGIRRADKLFVEINIRREFGIKDRRLSKEDLLELLKRENVTTIVVQNGYLEEQETMRNFKQLLDSGEYYKIVNTVRMRGDTRPDENLLTVYVRN